MRAVDAVILAAVLALHPTTGWTWGGEGHHQVGAIADAQIAGTNAEAQVRALLVDGNLEKYAIWADCAKGPAYCQSPPWFDDEMREFARTNPDHHQFHYTDIPIEEPRYRDNSMGAKPDDVVHKISDYIAILRAGPVTDQNRAEQRLALIMLAHLVGDIHQPLHVGAVYIGDDESIVNPNARQHTEETQGGNFLMRTRTANLHAFWDTDAVKEALKPPEPSTPTRLDAAVADMRANPAKWAVSGDAMEWSVVWASESLALARNKAFDGVKLGPRATVEDPRSHKPHLQWPITALPAQYRPHAGDIAAEQIAKAGFRLAALLNTIWP